MNYNNFRIYFQYIFLFLFVFLLFPNHFYNLPERGVDASWNIALHLAYKYHLEFGKDFIFTYGPLGILSARLPVAISLYVYLFFDLYFLGTVFFILKKIIWENFSFGPMIFVFLAIITAQYMPPDQWYFYFLLFFLFEFVKEPDNKAFLIQAALLSIIDFYVKVSLGMVGITIFLMTVSYVLVRKKWKTRTYLLVLVLYVLAFWVSSKILHTDLQGYIVASLHLINDYNDSMFRPLLTEWMIFGYSAIVVLCAVVLSLLYPWMRLFPKSTLNHRNKWLGKPDKLFVYAIVAFSVFIIFKSGFVRTDSHINIFFKNISLLTGFLFLYRPEKAAKRVLAVCCWLVLGVSFWVENRIPDGYEPYKRVLYFSFLSEKIDEASSYIREVGNYNHERAVSDSIGMAKNEWKDLIGDHSVDIIPMEISKIYFNGLRYDPRPVIQSYSVYNSYLDSLNYQKYVSPGAPDYILFSVNTVDDRFPFFDDSRTKLAILEHYSVVGEIRGDLLLKKRAGSSNLSGPGQEESRMVALGEDIPINQIPGIQYSRFFIDYSLSGKIRRFFYQPPALKVVFTFANGATESFRAIKSILADGVLVNKYISGQQEFQLLMRSDGRLNTKVRSIRIEPAEGTGGFVKSMRMTNTYYTINPKPASEEIRDSLALAALFDRYKPDIYDATLYEPDSIRAWMENFGPNTQFIKAEGWAFRVREQNDHCKVKAILRSGDKVYELPTEESARPDLAEAFKRTDMGKAGFSSWVSRSWLPPGDYRLGVAIVDADTQKKYIAYSGQHVVIGGDK